MKKILDSNMAKMDSYLADRGIVSNTLTETVDQGIYIYDKNATYNPNPNTMGVIYTKYLSAKNGIINVSVRLLVNTAYELYISTYISGASWGTWVKV